MLANDKMSNGIFAPHIGEGSARVSLVEENFIYQHSESHFKLQVEEYF